MTAIQLIFFYTRQAPAGPFSHPCSFMGIFGLKKSCSLLFGDLNLNPPHFLLKYPHNLCTQILCTQTGFLAHTALIF